MHHAVAATRDAEARARTAGRVAVDLESWPRRVPRSTPASRGWRSASCSIRSTSIFRRSPGEPATSYLAPALRHALGGPRAAIDARAARAARPDRAPRARTRRCAGSARRSIPRRDAGGELSEGARHRRERLHRRRRRARAAGQAASHVRVLLRPGTTPNVPEPAAVEIVRRRSARRVRGAHGRRGLHGDLPRRRRCTRSLADRTELHAINVGGTRNVLDAARAVGRARRPHLEHLDDRRHARRRDPRRAPGCRPASAPGPYKESKWQAEQMVREEAQRGPRRGHRQPDVSDRLGRREADADRRADPRLPERPHPRVRRHRDERGRRRRRRRGPLARVRARAARRALHPRQREPDDARAARAARADLGPQGAARAAAVRRGARARRTPMRSSRGAGSGVARVPLEGVRTAQEIRFASSARAVRELGLPQTPVRTALEKAVRWFQQHRTQKGVRS